MAIFNQSSPAKKDAPMANDPTPAFARDVSPAPAPTSVPQANTDFAPATMPRRAQETEIKESLIASGLTIEGKIEGAGHVRIAGKFKGDVNVQGDLTIEKGAKLNGGVRAKKVIVAGELEGNVESAERVEVLDTAVLTGDLKAGSLTVAAGSKIRGHVECGWEGKENTSKSNSNGHSKAEIELAS
ncbi:MAG: polymer-forming cytoskeletal protein [Luteimonas sp.]|nr:polymer-forming cytoskeletal protein [Luteimonas sp.]